MRLKPFEPYSQKERPGFNRLYFKYWDATSESWLYWERDEEKAGSLLGWRPPPRYPADVQEDESWIVSTKKRYEAGQLEFDRVTRISINGGVPKFETPEEAEAWLDEQ